MVEEGPEFQEQQQLSCKLVPWLSWDEWNFVRESLFSSSPHSVAAALKRVSAWRARGRLPVSIEVTAAIVEIQQKDPFFRDGLADDNLNSDEMLAMSYCMTIMRLVNGFLDKSCKEAKISISQSAEAFGIPRVLVDIRHEGSHRDLPSLPLVRSASLKALDWLRSSYWEPQRNLVPNVRKETESRMHEMVLCLNPRKTQQPNSSQTKIKRVKHSVPIFGRGRLFTRVARMLHAKSGDLPSKGFKKQKSILGSLIRLYSISPLEVAAVLLDFPLKTFDSLCSVEAVKCSSDIQAETNSSDSMCHQCTIDDWKAIVTRLASKEPALLLTMLEEVLVMIETREAKRFEMGDIHLPPAQHRAEIRQIEFLSTLIPWLLRNMIESRDSGSTQSINDSCSSTIPDAILSDLLHKCLLLSTPGNTNLVDSALLLANIMGKNSLTKRLKKLQQQNAPSPVQTMEDMTDDIARALQQEEDFIKRAAKKLEFLKSCQRKGETVVKPTNEDLEGNTWTVAKSWSKCPIGMLPRTFGSSGVLPVLESANTQLQENKNPVENEEFIERNKCFGKRESSCNFKSLGNLSPVKKMRETVLDDSELLDSQNLSFLDPVKGQLLIGGVWKRVEEEELLAIESGVRILV